MAVVSGGRHDVVWYFLEGYSKRFFVPLVPLLPGLLGCGGLGLGLFPLSLVAKAFSYANFDKFTLLTVYATNEYFFGFSI
jgi:hypothetical protein